MSIEQIVDTLLSIQNDRPSKIKIIVLKEREQKKDLKFDLIPLG